MADPETTTNNEAQEPQAQEQDINPWSVAGAQTDDGAVVAIDYEAICK
jgi:tryptophanyl-tRNA synthetase